VLLVLRSVPLHAQRHFRSCFHRAWPGW